MYTRTLFSFLKHRQLIWEMGVRELKAFNKGAILGLAWTVLNPLIQTIAYVIIITYILGARGVGGGTLDYAVYILSGMIPWQILTRSLQEAPSHIRNNTELIKQVIYPIEILPISRLIVSSFGSLISFIIFFALLLAGGGVSVSILLLPLPAALLYLLLIGSSWTFSVVGVVLKDLREIVTVFLSLVVYLSPVLLRESMVGRRVWQWILYNPLSHPVICFRDVFWGEFHLQSWLVFLFLALAAYFSGAWVISKSKTLINEYI